MVSVSISFAIILGLVLILPLGSAFAEEEKVGKNLTQNITDTVVGTDFVDPVFTTTLEGIAKRVDELSEKTEVQFQELEEKTDSNYRWGIAISGLIALGIALGITLFRNRWIQKKKD